jgi:hypothetical protein
MKPATKGSETSAGEQIFPSEKLDPNQNTQCTIEEEASTGGAKMNGGPRSKQGKQKSSRNSLKHGMFSDKFFLEGERRAEFNAFWAGLREYYQPEGTFEEQLVLKIVVTFLRQRRLIAVDGKLAQARADCPDLAFGTSLPVDLLIRYESHLERVLDRTLNQLERAQRMRRGQAVLPPINLNVSES